MAIAIPFFIVAQIDNNSHNYTLGK